MFNSIGILYMQGNMKKNDKEHTVILIYVFVHSQIDFIFVRLPEDIKLTSVATLDNGRRATMAPSDHIGVQATLKHTSSK